jgi:hypothetical protein
MHSDSDNEMAVLRGLAAAVPPARVDRRALPGLTVVKKCKGPVTTTTEERYKVGPGPSSSPTIGPVRITCDFYQRSTSPPAGQPATAIDSKHPETSEDGLTVSLVLC